MLRAGLVRQTAAGIYAWLPLGFRVLKKIEQIVREGAPTGTNRSDVFHTIVGHYVGVGWDIDRIFEHLSEYPRGIGERYLAEDRLRREIARSAIKFKKMELPLFDNFEAKAPPEPDPEPAPQPEPDQHVAHMKRVADRRVRACGDEGWGLRTA